MSENCLKLSPETFFALSFDCSPLGRQLTEKHRIPDPLDSVGIAHVYLGWSSEGLAAKVVVNTPFERSNVENGDAVLLYIDTRDLKSARSVHSFCHQFFFLPDGTAGECTRLRAQEIRSLCKPEALSISVSKLKTKISLEIGIPANCLHGYDPTQFPRIGFAYTICRGWRSPQSLVASSRELRLAAHPQLWASVRLASNHR